MFNSILSNCLNNATKTAAATTSPRFPGPINNMLMAIKIKPIVMNGKCSIEFL